RVVIRPTGHRPTIVDEVVLVGLGAFLGWRIGTWPALLGLAIAVAWDGLLPHRAGRRTYAVSLLVIVAGMLTALGLGEPDWEWIAPTVGEIVVLAIGVVGAVVAYSTEHPTSVGDLTGEPLNRQRLHMGRILGAGMALAAFAWLGGPGIVGAIPLWAAFVGTAASRFRSEER
ncbi:MAG: hypothetical protein HKN01_05690, partial [Acidimicrobiia bacterium]|nr:hypothetical protein [Acidimicrobiia bacterium]